MRISLRLLAILPGMIAATLLAAALLLAGPAWASLRGVALVIGNGDYQHLTPLPNPERDARAVEELLSDLGFDTTLSSDRDARRLARDLEGFIEDAEGADVAVLYYAGHGIEAGGENWLVPVDADISALDDAGAKLVPMSRIIADLQASVGVTIVLMDACRDNPFPPGAKLKLASGISAPVAAGGLTVGDARGAARLALAGPGESGRNETLGIVLGFAAEPGKVALDGAPGENSPYAAALVRHLSALTGVEFGQVMRMISEEVYLKTAGRQRPWVNESLHRQLYFGEAPVQPVGDDGDILAERRQLLLTIAALPNPERMQVERVAAAASVPMDAIFGILRALGTSAPSDPGKLEELLRTEADRFAKLLAEREVIENPDPEIVRLSALADSAEQEGLLTKAGELRERAKARFRELQPSLEAQQEALYRRFVEGAAVFARSAETRLLASDFLAAAEDYAQAFRLVQGRNHDLAWQYLDAQSVALAQHGHYRGDNAALERAIAVSTEALELAERLNNIDKRAKSQFALGNAQMRLGEREAGTARLVEAIATLTAAVESTPRTTRPVDWALAQRRLGAAQSALAYREQGTARLHAAAAAFRSAAEELTPERLPAEWARTQNNLGKVLVLLAWESGDQSMVEAGIAAYRAALRELPREDVPFDRAMVQRNLGEALSFLGNLSGDAASIEAAVDVYRVALEETSRTDSPLEWARLQSALADALRLLAQKAGGRQALEDAISAYRLALEETARDRVPLEWGSNQYRLGAALWSLSQLDGSAERLEMAVAALRSAAQELTRENIPMEWATLQSDLAVALQTLSQRRRDTALLHEAIAAHRAALDVLTGEQAALSWAATQYSLAMALQQLGTWESDVSVLAEALVSYTSALEVRTPERQPVEWAMTQYSLGTALQEIGRLTGDADRYVAAVASYRESLKIRTREQAPLHWAQSQTGIASASLVLARIRNDEAAYEAAVTAYESLLTYHSRGQGTRDWGTTQYNLGVALQALGLMLQDPNRLSRAAAAYRAALLERPRDDLPSEWASTLESLGNTLGALGMFTSDRQHLTESLEALRAVRDALREGGDLGRDASFEQRLVALEAARAKLD